MRCRWTVRRTMQPDSGRPTPLGPGLPGGADLDGGSGRRACRRVARSRRAGGGHEGGALCPGVDAASGAGADDRAAARAPAVHARRRAGTWRREQVFRDDGYSGAVPEAPGPRPPARRRAGARGRPGAGHRPRPAGAQLRPPDGAAGGTAGARLRGRVPRPADEPGPARPAAAADPRRGGRVRAHADRRAHAPRPAAQAAGRLLLPWTRPPYGYRVDPDRPRDPAGVTLDPAEAAVVRELFAWYVERGRQLLRAGAAPAAALGIRLAAGLQRWSSASSAGLLTNPTYTGQVYADRWRAAARSSGARDPRPASRRR